MIGFFLYTNLRVFVVRCCGFSYVEVLCVCVCAVIKAQFTTHANVYLTITDKISKLQRVA